MKHSRIWAATLLSALLVLLLSACGKERIIYVPVTVTPGGATGDTVAASPVAESDPLAQSTPLASPVAESTTTAPVTQGGGVASEPSDSAALPDTGAGRIAFMGAYGQSNAMQSFVVNSDGTGLTPVSEELGEGYFPNLSPDGKQVLYVANTSVDPDIYVTDVATGKSTNLTSKPGFDNQPLWSPDGTQIAFVTDREGGDVDIWIMKGDGSESTRLARTPGEDNLGSWSPDGTRLAYSNKNELGESLWVIDVKSGESEQLTENTGGSDSSPTWSPDGELIAFYSVTGGGIPTVFTVRPDGTEREQITGGTVPTLFPIWSPDGKWLLYTTINGDRRDITALNLATNETRVLPDIQGFATSWAATSEVLADTGFTQGPKQTGVEVDPEILKAAYRRGDPDAPIKIVEFSDYQCPFCQRWFSEVYPQLDSFIENGTVELIYVDFPLNIHPQAPAAAIAARCAGEAGGDEAYWKMHDELFANLSQWSGQSTPAPLFAQYATTIGLDGKALQACVESNRFQADVDAGLREGTRLGITGTPTFFINGSRLVGAQPWEAFQPYLTEAGQ